jgi:hypothetical protein
VKRRSVEVTLYVRDEAAWVSAFHGMVSVEVAECVDALLRALDRDEDRFHRLYAAGSPWPRSWFEVR